MGLRSWASLSFSIVALAAVVAMVVYFRIQNDGNSLDKYFLRDAKAMQEMGLPVYWLGQEFHAADLVSYGSGLGDDVEEGISMDYLAPVDGGNTVLQLAVYSEDAWARSDHHVKNPGVPNVSRRTVSVGSHEAEMTLVPLGTRPLNTLWLVIDLGEVVVLATANAGGEMYPGGPDYNPFINDPDLLVQVMQDLRPYPE